MWPTTAANCFVFAAYEAHLRRAREVAIRRRSSGRISLNHHLGTPSMLSTASDLVSSGLQKIQQQSAFSDDFAARIYSPGMLNRQVDIFKKSTA